VEQEIREPIKTHVVNERLRTGQKPVVEVLRSLGVRDPEDKNYEYGWRRPGYDPEIILSIWTEFVETDADGRWYAVEDLDWEHLLGGQERDQAQKDRARNRVLLMRELARTKTPFLGLLQVNQKTRAELMRGQASRASYRVRDSEYWHVASLSEEGKGEVVLVRGTSPWAGKRGNDVPQAAKYQHLLEGASFARAKAQEALPVLVRQARAAQTIFYSDLARELAVPNHRNLNVVLDAIGTALVAIGAAESQDIPPIQVLVVNKETGLPGEGFVLPLDADVALDDLREDQRRLVITAALQRVFLFPRWDQVLAWLGLAPLGVDFTSAITAASSFRGGGEGEQHKALKEYVAARPNLFDLRSGVRAVMEHPLPSGDSLDVSFDNGRDWVGVEVKSAISGLGDVTRGLFQCVKYRAVMEAVVVSEPRERSVRVVLVLEANLPPELVPLRNRLGVEVIEEISPSEIASAGTTGDQFGSGNDASTAATATPERRGA